jgi:hypothetical protein
MAFQPVDSLRTAARRLDRPVSCSRIRCRLWAGLTVIDAEKYRKFNNALAV